MWTIHHCRHCNMKHIKTKPIGIKKRSPEQIMEGTLDFIDKIQSGAIPRRNPFWIRAFAAEEVARYLRVRTHLVKQALHKLNLEGKVSKAINHAPHDSSRDRFGGGWDSAWCASYYRVIK